MLTMQTTVTGDTCLEANDLWLSYNGAAFALQGVDITLKGGTVTMLIGRSGSGKSTLLKVLTGLLKPQRGRVRLFDSVDSNGVPRRARVAYIPQTLGLVRSFTALENTLVGALPYTGTIPSMFKLFPRATVDEARQILTDVGLGHKWQEKVHHLSGGERQRVAIARALIQRPQVILADEFISQLDLVTAEDILGKMRSIAGLGVSLLITTHEFDTVARYADRLAVMRQGRIVHERPTDGLSRGEVMELLL